MIEMGVVQTTGPCAIIATSIQWCNQLDDGPMSLDQDQCVKKCSYSNEVGLRVMTKVVKIGILRRIVRGKWDRGSNDRIVDRKILHIFIFKAKNILIMTLYVK